MRFIHCANYILCVLYIKTVYQTVCFSFHFPWRLCLFCLIIIFLVCCRSKWLHDIFFLCVSLSTKRLKVFIGLLFSSIEFALSWVLGAGAWFIRRKLHVWRTKKKIRLGRDISTNIYTVSHELRICDVYFLFL